MAKYDFSSTWNAFFVKCPGCGKEVQPGEERHETVVVTWHKACWKKADEKDEPVVFSQYPAYGDYEGTGWMEE